MPKGISIANAGRCVLYLFNLLLLALLAVNLAILASIYHHGDLVVPEFALQRLEAKLASNNLYVRCDQIEVDFHGNLLLTGVEAGSLDYSDVMLQADQVLVRVFPWALLWGRLHIESVQINQLSLHCPAVISATGIREEIVSGVNLSAQRSGPEWIIEQFDAHFGKLHALASGSFTLPRKIGVTRRDEPVNWKPFMHRMAEISAKLAAFDQPVLIVDFGNHGEHLSLRGEFRWQAMQYGGEPAVGPGAVFVTLAWDWHQQIGHMIRPPFIYVSDMTVAGITLAKLHGSVTSGAEELLYGRMPLGIDFALASVQWGELTTQSIHGALDISRYPSVEGILNFNNGSDWISYRGSFDWRYKSASGQVHTQINPMPYLASAGIDFRHKEWFHFEDPVTLSGDVQYNPETWEFNNFKIWLGKAAIAALKIEDAFIQGDLNPQSLSIRDSYASTAHYQAEGSYFQNLRTGDYRFLLSGSVNPLDISAFIDESWWDELWQRFTFGDHLPDASIDLQGRYRGGRQYNRMFGNARLDAFHYNDVPIKSASALLWQDAGKFRLMDLRIDADEGQAWVNLQWYYPLDYDEGEGHSLAFNGVTRLPLPMAADIIGDETEPYFNLFSLDGAPEIRIFGVAVAEEAEGPTNQVYLNLAADIDRPVTFHNYHFDDLYFETLVKPGLFYVKQTEFGIAGGEGSGWIRHEPYSNGQYLLSLALQITDSRYADLLDAVPLMASLKPDIPDEPGEPEAAPPVGLVSGSIELRGIAGDTRTFVGKGSGRISQASLGRLHLFGMFSRFLHELGLPLGVLDFKQARSPFEIAQGIIHLSDLQITGPAARISAHGNIGIESSSLELAMHLYPLGALRIPILSEFLSMVNPVSNAIELKVSGTLQQPEFSASINPLRAVTGRQNHIRLENNGNELTD